MGKIGRPKQEKVVRQCIYCGANVVNKHICDNCRKKRKLIRQILTSVKNYKAEVKGNG